MNPTITAVAGLEAGHYTDRANATGCTVILCEAGAVGGVDVRGSAPVTRETDQLHPGNLISEVHAVLLWHEVAFMTVVAGIKVGVAALMGVLVV